MYSFAINTQFEFGPYTLMPVIIVDISHYNIHNDNAFIVKLRIGNSQARNILISFQREDKEILPVLEILLGI